MQNFKKSDSELLEELMMEGERHIKLIHFCLHLIREAETGGDLLAIVSSKDALFETFAEILAKAGAPKYWIEEFANSGWKNGD